MTCHVERRYVHKAVVPGMALYLNCTSDCRGPRASDDVTWMFSRYSGDTASSRRPVEVRTDDNYIVSWDGGLVILRVDSSQHSGSFYCTASLRPADTSSQPAVLVEHRVTMSGQSSVINHLIANMLHSTYSQVANAGERIWNMCNGVV